MKATANLNRKKEVVTDGNDSIVIVNDLGDIPGGRALQMDIIPNEILADAFPDGVVRAGHVIVKVDGAEVGYRPIYIPMPIDPETQRYIDNGNSSSEPDFEYAGVLKHSVPVDNAQAAILTIGQVNAAASPYPVTDAIAAALPRIQFLYRDQDSRLNN